MARRIGTGLDEGRCDLPTWTNVLVIGETPINWSTDPGEPEPGDELAGRLVFGSEQQLVIDMCGSAVTNLLAVLARVQDSAEDATIEGCTERAGGCAGTL